MVWLYFISVLVNLVSVGALALALLRANARAKHQREELMGRLSVLNVELQRSADRVARLERHLSDLERASHAMPVSLSGVEPLARPSRSPLAAEEPQKPAEAPQLDLTKAQPLLDYNRARSMNLEDGELWFTERYPELKRLSCTNRTSLGSRQLDLRFEFSARGAFLAVAHGRQFLLFPLLTDRFSVARGQLEGVFVYPPEGPGKLTLVRPAVVERSPEGVLVLSKAGHGEFAYQPGSRRPSESPDSPARQRTQASGASPSDSLLNPAHKE